MPGSITGRGERTKPNSVPKTLVVGVLWPPGRFAFNAWLGDCLVAAPIGLLVTLRFEVRHYRSRLLFSQVCFDQKLTSGVVLSPDCPTRPARLPSPVAGPLSIRIGKRYLVHCIVSFAIGDSEKRVPYRCLGEYDVTVLSHFIIQSSGDIGDQLDLNLFADPESGRCCNYGIDQGICGLGPEELRHLIKPSQGDRNQLIGSDAGFDQMGYDRIWKFVEIAIADFAPSARKRRMNAFAPKRMRINLS